MNRWQAEPLWETLDRLQAVYQVCATDTLVVVLRESARLPRLVGRRYGGLDILKGRLVLG